MKIMTTVELTETEKYVIANAGDVKNVKTENDGLTKVIEGDFGKIVFGTNDTMEIYIETGAVIDAVNIISSLSSLLETFDKKWTKNTTSKVFDKDGNEVVKVWNEDHTKYDWVRKEEIEEANKEKEEVKTTEATEEEVKEA